MECEEIRVDTRAPHTQEELEAFQKSTELLWQFNQAMPGSEESLSALRELMGDNLGEHSRINAPLRGAALEKLKIGDHVIIVGNLLAMARGGITIEDYARIAANVQLISNNHDPYDRAVLPCKPVLIKEGAWIGAGATVLPGVCVGRYAIVGAASVVTKDVPDYAVVVGNPARVIRMLDAERCEAQNRKKQ